MGAIKQPLHHSLFRGDSGEGMPFEEPDNQYDVDRNDSMHAIYRVSHGHTFTLQQNANLNGIFQVNKGGNHSNSFTNQPSLRKSDQSEGNHAKTYGSKQNLFQVNLAKHNTMDPHNSTFMQSRAESSRHPDQWKFEVIHNADSLGQFRGNQGLRDPFTGPGFQRNAMDTSFNRRPHTPLKNDTQITPQGTSYRQINFNVQYPPPAVNYNDYSYKKPHYEDN